MLSPRHYFGGLALAATLSAADCPVVIDPARSQVEVVVKATVDSFTARLQPFACDIGWDDAAMRVTHATFDFRFLDLFTGKGERDRQMHDWQQSSQYPSGHFELATLEPAEAGHWLAHGTLQFHGVSRALTFPIVVTDGGERLAIDGEARIDVREFGLPVIRKFAMLKVNPQVLVRFHLQGRIAAATAEGRP